MTTRWPVLVSFICLASAAIGARQPASQPVLSDQQKEGRRIFQQKCALCHVPILPSDGSGQPYARPLHKPAAGSSDDAVRRTIADGLAPRMPGWKYALSAGQIDALVSYVKTLETPGRTVGVEQSELR
jgi:mono/diheme cytochrome c family protein